MKILYIIPSFNNSGPINMCLNLIKEISLYCEVYVCSLQSGLLKNEFDKYAIETKLFNYSNIFSILNYINKSNFDVVHSHCLLPDIILSLANKKIFKVSTIHNFLFLDYRHEKGFFLGKLIELISRFSLRKFTVKVGCSESASTYCRNKYSMKNILSIHNGVPDRFEGSYLKNNKTINYFYLGGINRNKNVSTILCSFIKWNHNKNNILHIIGSGDSLCFLEKKYKNKSIIFHGKQDKPHELIKNMDCFVSASRTEGLPLAMLEALSLGKIFICSAIPSHIEVMNSSKNKIGIIVKNCEEEFIKGFELSTKLDLVSASHSARDAYLKNFSSKIMADKYHKLYLNSLSKA